MNIALALLLNIIVPQALVVTVPPVANAVAVEMRSTGEAIAQVLPAAPTKEIQ